MGKIENQKNWEWTFMFLIICVSCLFAYWLISTLSKIATNLIEINRKIENTESKDESAISNASAEAH